MPKQERQILDTPLTPKILERIEVMTSLPGNEGFDPVGTWSHTYLIWTNHGYDYGNIDAGYLTINRKPAADGSIDLSVVTEIALLDGIGARTSARIRCQPDSLTSPESWELDSTFSDPSGADLPDQNTHQKAILSDNQLTVDVNGQHTETPVGRPITGDWCLFDAVQRLPKDETHHSCDVLERMLTVKRNQSIRHAGETVNVVGHNLTRFTRIGVATLPTDYWVDDNGRLVLVIAYNMIYLLSDTAIDTFNASLVEQREKAGHA